MFVETTDGWLFVFEAGKAGWWRHLAAFLITTSTLVARFSHRVQESVCHKLAQQNLQQSFVKFFLT